LTGDILVAIFISTGLGCKNPVHPNSKAKTASRLGEARLEDNGSLLAEASLGYEFDRGWRSKTNGRRREAYVSNRRRAKGPFRLDNKPESTW
jgi:hypothetical protein